MASGLSSWASVQGRLAARGDVTALKPSSWALSTRMPANCGSCSTIRTTRSPGWIASRWSAADLRPSGTRTGRRLADRGPGLGPARGRLERTAPTVPGWARGDGGHVVQGQVEREGAPLAERALDPDLAAEQPGDLPADRQAQAGAAVLAAGARVGLLERLEDDLQLVRRDADAGVAHRERDDRGPPGRGPGGRRSSPPWPGRPAGSTLPVLGELEGVGQQVPQHLLQPLRVGGDGPRQAVGQLDLERQVLRLGHRAEGPLDVVAQVGERHVADVDRPSSPTRSWPCRGCR